jgi:hypothetical protein
VEDAVADQMLVGVAVVAAVHAVGVTVKQSRRPELDRSRHDVTILVLWLLLLQEGRGVDPGFFGGRQGVAVGAIPALFIVVGGVWARCRRRRSSGKVPEGKLRLALRLHRGELKITDIVDQPPISCLLIVLVGRVGR